jgi:NADH-quinone oxidoreductase subunit L
MRKMGGLRKHTPITFWTMTAGVFAISGIYPFAGFFSKDEILYNVFVSANPLGKFLWFVGLVTAGMTSFYMFRLWFKTFFGPERFEENPVLHDHGAAVHSHSGTHAVMEAEHDAGQAAHPHGVHESPWIMLFPLTVLAILSVIGGGRQSRPGAGSCRNLTAHRALWPVPRLRLLLQKARHGSRAGTAGSCALSPGRSEVLCR